MDYINLKSRAKINISLDVIKKLDSGYHDLEMIMQSISLYDNLFMKKINSDKVVLKTNISWLPTDNRNLVYRATSIMRERFNVKEGVYISLYKRIPVSAGLAGGSSDCAATLIGMKNLFNLPISRSELLEFGKTLGADIPFCITRGTALAQGIGDKLTPLKPFPKCYVLIAKPSIIVSTSSVFGGFNFSKIVDRPDTEKLIYYIKKSDLDNICNNLCNVLETVTIERYPIISEIKEFMIKNGALGSIMSGSGPTVFGIFREKHKAFNTMKKIKNKFRIEECYLSNIFNMY